MFYARSPKFFVLTECVARPPYLQITWRSRLLGESRDSDPAESLHTTRRSRVFPSRRIKRRDAVRVH